MCLATAQVIIAEINANGTALRSFPGEKATITRSAYRGERFEIVLETGQNNWYNIVDAATQASYWITGDSVKLIRGRGKAIKNTSPKLPKAQRNKKRRHG